MGLRWSNGASRSRPVLTGTPWAKSVSRRSWNRRRCERNLPLKCPVPEANHSSLRFIFYFVLGTSGPVPCHSSVVVPGSMVPAIFRDESGLTSQQDLSQKRCCPAHSPYWREDMPDHQAERSLAWTKCGRLKK